MPGLHFAWHRGSGCLGAAAPVTGAAADEYNLNVVDCNASVTVARRSSISVSIQYSVICDRGNGVIHRGIQYSVAKNLLQSVGSRRRQT